MQRGQVLCCDIFPSFIGISSGFGVLEPRIHHLSFSGPKMAFSSSQNYVSKGKWPILKREMLQNKEKRQKDKWYPFLACTPPPHSYYTVNPSLRGRRFRNEPGDQHGLRKEATWRDPQCP